MEDVVLSSVVVGDSSSGQLLRGNGRFIGQLLLLLVNKFIIKFAFEFNFVSVAAFATKKPTKTEESFAEIAHSFFL
jgi:hypothetical protein